MFLCERLAVTLKLSFFSWFYRHFSQKKIFRQKMSQFLRFSSFFGMYSMDNNQRKRAHIMNFNYNDTNSWSYRKLTITEEWQIYRCNKTNSGGTVRRRDRAWDLPSKLSLREASPRSWRERRARAAGEPASVLSNAKTRVCLAGRRPPARAMLVSYKTIGFDLNSSEMLFKLFLISGHSEVRRS